MSKYHNVQVTVGGRVYASRREADRATVLRLMERAGKISGLQEQVRFEIVPEVRTAPGMDRYAGWAIVDAELAYQAAARQIREGIQPICPIYGTVRTGYHVRGSKLLERKAEYVADFVYFNQDGRMVVEDAKGVRTREYILKRKLMLWVYGIAIKEV